MAYDPARSARPLKYESGGGVKGRMRISLMGLMLVVIVIACGLAALRDPSELTSSLVFTAAVSPPGRGDHRDLAGPSSVVGGLRCIRPVGVVPRLRFEARCTSAPEAIDDVPAP